MRQKGSCRNREVMPDDMSGKDEGQSISDPEDPSALTQDLEELLKLWAVDGEDGGGRCLLGGVLRYIEDGGAFVDIELTVVSVVGVGERDPGVVDLTPVVGGAGHQQGADDHRQQGAQSAPEIVHWPFLELGSGFFHEKRPPVSPLRPKGGGTVFTYFPRVRGNRLAISTGEI